MKNIFLILSCKVTYLDYFFTMFCKEIRLYRIFIDFVFQFLNVQSINSTAYRKMICTNIRVCIPHATLLVRNENFRTKFIPGSRILN